MVMTMITSGVLWWWRWWLRPIAMHCAHNVGPKKLTTRELSFKVGQPSQYALPCHLLHCIALLCIHENCFQLVLPAELTLPYPVPPLWAIAYPINAMVLNTSGPNLYGSCPCYPNDYDIDWQPQLASGGFNWCPCTHYIQSCNTTSDSRLILNQYK